MSVRATNLGMPCVPFRLLESNDYTQKLNQSVNPRRPKQAVDEKNVMLYMKTSRSNLSTQSSSSVEHILT